MEGVFVSDERNPADPYVITARKGAMDVDPATGYAYLTLTDGGIHKKGISPGSYQEIKFDKNTLSINLYEKYLADGDGKRGRREMTLSELVRLAREMHNAGASSYPLLTEYYKRFTIPLACILFGMAGPPLGLYARRSGRSLGMSMALAIFVLYYLLMKGGEDLAASGRVQPLLAVVLPNAVIGGLGAYLLALAVRERPAAPAALADAWRRWTRLRAGRARAKGGRGR